MALHRENTSCNSRSRENGTALDTRSELYDGTPIETPGDLTRALLGRPIPLLRTFTENLMAYALGRRVEYYDQPTVREITNKAEENDYRISSFIMGFIKSDAFQMQSAGSSLAAPQGEQEIR